MRRAKVTAAHCGEFQRYYVEVCENVSVPHQPEWRFLSWHAREVTAIAAAQHWVSHRVTAIVDPGGKIIRV
jgi:hypothetical protein